MVAGEPITPAGANQPFRFRTEDVLPRDRTAIWREVLGRVHLHLDVEQIGDAPLRATVESHRWATTSFYFSDTTPVRASRTAEFVADGDGDFRLLRADGAPFRYVANGVDEVIDQSGSALLFNGVVSSVQYLGPCHVTSIRLRRVDLANAVRGLDDRALRRVDPASPALRLLHAYTALLRREGPTGDPVFAAQVAHHVIDLMALALGASGDAAEIARGRGLRAARIKALKADILANLANPELSLSALAARHGVTPRYVRMLFESENLSFTDFVLDQRLALSQRMVSDPRYANERISAIAFATGFGDLSYFNRTFRKRFGATPSELRANTVRET